MNRARVTSSVIAVAVSLLTGCKSQQRATSSRIPALEQTTVITSGADDIFKDRHLAPGDAAIPEDYAGAVLWMEMDPVTKQAAWYFEPLDVNEPTSTKLDAKVFESVVDRGFLAGANVTLFVSISAGMKAEDKAQLLIQDLYSLRAPTASQAAAQIAGWVSAHRRRPIVGAYYCRAARFSTAISQVFSRVSGSAKVSGAVFAVNGEFYHSDMRYLARTFVSLDVTPVDLPAPPTGIGPMQAPLEFPAMKRLSVDGR